MLSYLPATFACLASAIVMLTMFVRPIVRPQRTQHVDALVVTLLGFGAMASIAAIPFATRPSVLRLGHIDMFDFTSVIGLSFLVDRVTLAMLAAICVVGLVVYRFSTRYLLGEVHQGRFLGWRPRADPDGARRRRQLHQPRLLRRERLAFGPREREEDDSQRDGRGRRRPRQHGRPRGGPRVAVGPRRNAPKARADTAPSVHRGHDRAGGCGPRTARFAPRSRAQRVHRPAHARPLLGRVHAPHPGARMVRGGRDEGRLTRVRLSPGCAPPP